MAFTMYRATANGANDFTEHLLEITSSITQLLQNLDDSTGTIVSRSLHEAVATAEMHGFHEGVKGILGMIKTLVDEASDACTKVTQEQFDSSRGDISNVINQIKGFRTKLDTLVVSIISIFTNQNAVLTLSAQKVVAEHKFEEVFVFQRAIDSATETKADIITFVEALISSIDVLYIKIEDMARIFLQSNLKSFPSASEVSQLSRKRWRDDLTELEEEAGITANLHLALTLLKCLICDAAKNGSKYIVIARENSPANVLSVFYDYHSSYAVLRLDELWLQHNSRWPQTSEDSVSYCDCIKSVSIQWTYVKHFSNTWKTDVGQYKIMEELMKLGYVVGTVNLQPMTSSTSAKGNIDDATFNKAVGAATSSDQDVFNKFAGGRISFHPGSLVINLWGDESAYTNPIADIITREGMHPFENVSYEMSMPFFYIKPNMSEYVNIPNRGIYHKEECDVETDPRSQIKYPILKNSNANPVLYHGFRQSIVEEKYDKIVKFEPVMLHCIFAMGRIEWMELPQNVKIKISKGDK